LPHFLIFGFVKPPGNSETAAPSPRPSPTRGEGKSKTGDKGQVSRGFSKTIAVRINQLWYNSGKLVVGGERLFFKKRVLRDDDRIWVTTDQKWNGIVNEILKERSESVFILVVAHFKKTAAELKKQFQSRGLEFKDYEWHSHFGQWEKADTNQPVLIMAVNISELEGAIRQFGKDKRVLVLVAEHYPLPEGDEALFSFLSNLPCSSTIRFHSALDEPFFKMFGGEGMSSAIKMIQTLQPNENEYISHRFVTSAIRKAQENIKKKVRGNNRVDSMEEWFQYNLNIG
jgi:hypothetical protein